MHDQVITVADRTGPEAANALRDEVWSAISGGEVRELVVDLTRATRLDSALIGAIVAADRAVTERNGRLSVWSTHPGVTAAIERLGLANRVRCSDRANCLQATRFAY